VRVVVPEVDFRIDSVACVGEDVVAELLTPFLDGARYVWDWDVAPASVRQVRPGRWAVRWDGAGQRRVRLRVELAGCSSAEVSREVSVYPVPEARFTSTPKRGLVPLRVQFTNETTPPDVRHRWDFGDGETGNARNPFHLYRRPGTYFVHYEAFTVGGCRSEWRDTVVVEPLELFIPNAFTPNGDGVNDRFELLNLHGLESFELLIFDRWGVLVFESRSPSDIWDGTKDGVPVPEGVYVWRLTLREVGREGQQVRVGSVTVLR
jgi:gliding motility-associated-like protein